MARTTYGPSQAATTIDMSGPFFEADVDKTYFANVRAMLDAVAAEGEADVKVQMPVVTGESRAGVIGRTRSVAGQPWFLTAVVSEYPDDAAAMRAFPWRRHGARGFAGRGEAIYRGGRLEAQRHMFRNTATRLRKSARVAMANLTKGLE